MKNVLISTIIAAVVSIVSGVHDVDHNVEKPEDSPNNGIYLFDPNYPDNR